MPRKKRWPHTEQLHLLKRYFEILTFSLYELVFRLSSYFYKSYTHYEPVNAYMTLSILPLSNLLISIITTYYPFQFKLEYALSFHYAFLHISFPTFFHKLPHHP